MKPILQHVTEKMITDFQDSPDYSNLICAAQWCLQHNMFQQAATFLQEGITSFYCQQMGWDIFDKTRRNAISSALNVIYRQLRVDEWKGSAEHIALMQDIIGHQTITDKMAKTYSAITEIRNTMNHANMNTNKELGSDLSKKIESLILKAEEGCIKREPLLVNLSNHPSHTWKDAQMEAASCYGKVMDLPFPHISSGISEDDIQTLAENFLQQIIELNNTHKVTVHLMGEMTFTFRLVLMLKKAGIPCIAACSERVVQESDGKRLSEFHFERFRMY